MLNKFRRANEITNMFQMKSSFTKPRISKTKLPSINKKKNKKEEEKVEEKKKKLIKKNVCQQTENNDYTQINKHCFLTNESKALLKCNQDDIALFFCLN